MITPAGPSSAPAPPGPPEPHAGISPPDLRWIADAVDWVTPGRAASLLLVAAAAAAVAIAVGAVLGRWRHRRHTNGARLVTVAPPPQVDPHSAASFWANVHGVLTPSRRRRRRYGVAHLVWQYTWTGRQLVISAWVPGTIPPGTVEAAIRAAWPGAACTTSPATSPLPADASHTAGGQLRLRSGEWLPLRTDHDTDPLRALTSAAGQLRTGEHACVQVLARPAPARRIRRARRAVTGLRDGRAPHAHPLTPLAWVLDAIWPAAAPHRTTTSRRDPHTDRDVRASLEKTHQPLWTVAVRYGVATADTRRSTNPAGRLHGVGDAIASSFAAYDGPNRLAHRTRLRTPDRALDARAHRGGFLAGTAEVAALAALPTDLAVPGLARAAAKPMPAPPSIPAGGRAIKILGNAEMGGHAVGLSVADARYHLHVIGSTGAGKTTLLVNMAVDDIRSGRGTVVIDPHGDIVLDILDRLPATVADRVVIFDPDQPNPPTINPLEGDDPDLVVDNLVSIFGNIFVKAWGPRMDDVMRVACLTLLRHANVTLQHIPPLLNSPRFRAAMTADLDDPAGLSGFWQWYDELTPALRSQVIGPVLARLRAFLLRDFVKRTMRYPRSSVDMRRILDGGALLVRIPKGQLGEETTRLLGSLILAQVWQAATARAAIAPDRRRDASLYIDEAQNFLTLANSLDTMLAEARKYRVSLTLGHQDLAQFPRELLAAASANARNKVYFTSSPEDARTLARHTLPELDEHDLTNLDRYTVAARLMVDGRQTPAFTMRTRPAKPVVGEATAIRQAAAAAVPAQDTSAVDAIVERLTRRLLDREKRTTPAAQTPTRRAGSDPERTS
ncbi:DUF87 domain-containing protein [Asanoa sp. NPDC049518]|uniref:helicase HerA domain-containing protein n=1 Tax=unclassified Asanoa TaxID=2685164 RepID=UPI00341F0D55